MEFVQFSIVVTTYNRNELLKRAINSINKVNYPKDKIEIIVVDDCSLIKPEVSDDVQLIIKDFNSGPCISRNIGISAASHKWILCLDDDDELCANSLAFIDKVIKLDDLYEYPAAFFLRSQSKDCNNCDMNGAGLILDGVKYIRKCSGKEFIPLINKDLFLDKYSFPLYRVGGESLLWLNICQNQGLPTYFTNVGILNSDASDRLTGKSTKIKYPEQYFNINKELLESYCDIFRKVGVSFFYKKIFNLLVYGLMSGNVKNSIRFIWMKCGVVTKIVSLLLIPIACIRVFSINRINC